LFLRMREGGSMLAAAPEKRVQTFSTLITPCKDSTSKVKFIQKIYFFAPVE
jgi:hypothetical protein